MSTVLGVLSVLSFLLATWFVETIANSCQRMTRLHVLATFFQANEFTTLIKINWPKWVDFTLPLQLPISDFKCLASSSGWNQLVHNFSRHTANSVPIFNAINSSFFATRFPRRSPRSTSRPPPSHDTTSSCSPSCPAALPPSSATPSPSSAPHQPTTKTR